MKCEETMELMSMSLDGMLDPDQQARLESHLAECANCRSELERLHRSVSLLRDVEPVAVPPGLETRICEAVRESAQRPLVWNWFNRPQVRAVLAASVALVLGIFALEKLGPPAKERTPVSAAERAVETSPKKETETVSAPAADAAPAANTPVAVRPPEEEEQSRAPAMSVSEPPAPAPALPSKAKAEAAPVRPVAAVKRAKSDAIWQGAQPSVRGGLQVGDATPLAEGAPAQVPRRARMAVGAHTGAPAMDQPAREAQAPAALLQAERAAVPRQQKKLLVPRALRAAESKGAMVDHGEADDRAVPAEHGRDSLAEGATTAGRAAPYRKDADGGRSFTVTGMTEKRVLALLAAGPRANDQQRARSAAGGSARGARDMSAEAAPLPVVTRLADGCVRIVATVQSADLPELLDALGKEGTVRATEEQPKPAKTQGPLLVEFVLTP